MATIAEDLGVLHKHYLWTQEQAVAAKSSSRAYKIAVCFFIVLLAQLWIRVSLIQSAYTLEYLRKKVLSNDSFLRQQRLELAYRTRPSALLEQAKARLSMEVSPPQRIRQISYVGE